MNGLDKKGSVVPHTIKLFMKIYEETQNQFSAPIHVLHADNAIKYMRANVFLFCATNAIIHPTSCCYISQQNGITQKKYKYIVDVAHTLRMYMYVSRYLSSNVFLCAFD